MSDDPTVREHRVAREAMLQAAKGSGGYGAKDQLRQEIVARFVQLAVDEVYLDMSEGGQGPSALKQFLDKVRKLMEKAIAKLYGSSGTLTMEDVVLMAQGSVATRWDYDQPKEGSLMDLQIDDKLLSGLDNNRTGEDADRQRKARERMKRGTTAHVPPLPADPDESSRAAHTERAVGQTMAKTGVQVLDDVSSLWRKLTGSLKFLHQFVDENRDKLPAMGTWHTRMAAMEKTRNEIMDDVHKVVNLHLTLSPAKQKQVNAFVADSTFSQKWGYNPGFDRRVQVSPAMARKFDALDATQQAVVKGVFAHGERMRLEKLKLAKAAGVTMKNMTFMPSGSLTGPYAPLMRFGNHAVEMKSKDLVQLQSIANPSNHILGRIDKMKSDERHYRVSFFETAGAAKRHARENRGKYFSAEPSERPPPDRDMGSADSRMVEKIIGYMGAGGRMEVDPEARKAFERLVQDVYFLEMDDRNARMQGTRRRYRHGYDEDMMRAFLARSRSEARLVSRMEHGRDVQQAFMQMRREAGTGEDRDGRQAAFNMAAKHYYDSLAVQDTPWQDRVAGLNSLFMLTSSVGYHFTNLTQPMMVTVPKLAGDSGSYDRAWTRLLKGYAVAWRVVSMTGGLRMQAEVDVGSAPEQYRDMLEDLQLRGLLDVGMEEDLGAFDQSPTGYGHVDRASGGLSTLMHHLYQAARWVEAVNRVAASVAAFDMAGDRGARRWLGGMDRGKYARHIVQATQGDFTRLGAPLLLKGVPFAKIIMQYKKFVVMMAWLSVNALKQAAKGATPQERAAGQRTLMLVSAHGALFGGATGVPGVSTFASLVALFWGDEEPEDLEGWIRENVEDETMAQALANGVPSLLGLDMSTKLALDNIFDPVPYADLEASPQGVMETAYALLTGPAGTTAMNFFGRGPSYIAKGDIVKGVEYMVPKGLRSMLEAFRLSTEGYSLPNGDVVADPRDFDLKDALITGLGLHATDVANVKWRRGQQYEMEQWFSERTSDIRRRYADAHDSRDRAEMRRLRREWVELQKRKDRVRWLFSDAPHALRRQSVGALTRSVGERTRRERRNRERMGG